MDELEFIMYTENTPASKLPYSRSESVAGDESGISY
jgi:hypothetical protein